MKRTSLVLDEDGHGFYRNDAARAESRRSAQATEGSPRGRRELDLGTKLGFHESVFGAVDLMGKRAESRLDPPPETTTLPASPMITKSLLPLALLAPVGLALALDLRVEPDEGNVTAGRLEGHWVSDAPLSERLGVTASSTQVEFVVDDSFLESLPDKAVEALKKKQVFEAGRVTWREGTGPRTFPYLLVNHSGNPVLLTFRERFGEPLADIESANLMVIPGKEHAKDLLFIGGDFDNQAFKPFRRVVKPAK